MVWCGVVGYSLLPPTYSPLPAAYCLTSHLLPTPSSPHTHFPTLSQVVFYLIDLLQDKNKEVQRVADQCLDIVMDTDEEWAVRIRNLKFEAFNQEWLEVVASPDGAAGRGDMYDQQGGGDIDYDDDGYTIGGQRVMNDFEEMDDGGQQWAPGQGGAEYGYDQDQYDGGQYDEEELRRVYQGV